MRADELNGATSIYKARTGRRRLPCESTAGHEQRVVRRTCGFLDAGGAARALAHASQHATVLFIFNYVNSGRPFAILPTQTWWLVWLKAPRQGDKQSVVGRHGRKQRRTRKNSLGCASGNEKYSRWTSVEHTKCNTKWCGLGHGRCASVPSETLRVLCGYSEHQRRVLFSRMRGGSVADNHGHPRRVQVVVSLVAHRVAGCDARPAAAFDLKVSGDHAKTIHM